VNAETARAHPSRLPEDAVTPICPAWDDGYKCTLDAGHAGDHKAYDSDGVLCRTWPQDGHPAITVISSHRAVFVGRGNGGEYWCKCGVWFLTPDLLVAHLLEVVEAAKAAS
jgi:hypothetical protein